MFLPYRSNVLLDSGSTNHTTNEWTSKMFLLNTGQSIWTSSYENFYRAWTDGRTMMRRHFRQSKHPLVGENMKNTLFPSPGYICVKRDSCCSRRHQSKTTTWSVSSRMDGWRTCFGALSLSPIERKNHVLQFKMVLRDKRLPVFSEPLRKKIKTKALAPTPEYSNEEN